jgi:hypothetical protein
MQRRISVMEEEFGEKLERIMPEPEEMTERVKHPSKNTRQVSEHLSKR